MALPDVIQIRPLTVPVCATISVPGSKSLTNRELVLAALGNGPTLLRGALWSEDTRLMVECLKRLGFTIEVTDDATNSSNRTITVQGQGGRVPAREADLFVGTAGTAARFLAAVCALGTGRYHLHGTPRMHERPMKEVFDAIRALGAKVEDSNGRLPATISGPIREGSVAVPSIDSSQFASAMILISRTANIRVDSPSSPYVDMTRRLMEEWSKPAATREIEPDASSASYFVALQRLHPGGRLDLGARFAQPSLQIDHRMSADKFWTPFPKRVSRRSDLGDSVLTLVIAAAAMKQSFHLIEAANLREQECDRISALAVELTKCGVPVKEEPEGLILEPASRFQPATIHTYNDHRIAMSFAVLASMDAMGNGKPWITIENPSCVEKTFPNFFETLESLARQSNEAAGKPHQPMVSR